MSFTVRQPGRVPWSTSPRRLRPMHVRRDEARKSILTAGVLVALLLVRPAFAQTQAQMNTQAGAAFRAADAALNAQWKRTLASMKRRDAAGPPSGHAGVLLAGQRAWLTYRDAHCRLSASRFAGGSAEPMEVSHCMADLTRQRTRQLADLVTER